MIVKQKSYTLPNGSNVINDPELAFTRPLRVRVDGLGFDLIQGTPDNREVQHTIISGDLVFSVSGYGSNGSGAGGTKVSVIFKY